MHSTASILAERSRKNSENAATLRRVINLAKRAARGVFAPNFSMAVSAVGAAGVYFSAVIGHDMAAAAFTFAVMPWLMAAICHNPSAKKGGEI